MNKKELKQAKAETLIKEIKEMKEDMRINFKKVKISYDRIMAMLEEIKEDLEGEKENE
ncbi:MAG: hypothetical protein ACOC5T_09665 [Elusimicrobiota bacterium]